MIRSNKGFSLVETMLAIGISTGTALLVYKVLGDSQKGQMMLENRDDMNQVHREIIGKFTDRNNCTATLSDGMNKGEPQFKIPAIKNKEAIDTLKIPATFGKISLADLEVRSVDRIKRTAELAATYSHTLAGKENTTTKLIRVDLSYGADGKFEGCVTRGSLALDPKDACDLVVGLDANNESYFYNGKCNFARGACEQSNRSWNEAELKCNFSEEDLEALRQQICETLYYKYSSEQKKCLPTDEMIEAVQKLQEQMKQR